MSINETAIIEQLKSLLGTRCLEFKAEKRRIFIKVNSDDYKSVIQDIVTNLGIKHLSTITGLDNSNEIEVLAHLFGKGNEITVKTALPRENPEISSITEIIPGADFYERELHDLLGVQFKGRQKPDRFILPEDWPQGVYPLRKDFKKIE